MKNEKRKLNIGCVWELPTGMGEREGMSKVYMYVYTFLKEYIKSQLNLILTDVKGLIHFIRGSLFVPT